MGGLRVNAPCSVLSSLALSLQCSIRPCGPLIQPLLAFPSAPSKHLDCDLPYWLSSLRQWSNTHTHTHTLTWLITISTQLCANNVWASVFVCVCIELVVCGSQCLSAFQSVCVLWLLQPLKPPLQPLTVWSLPQKSQSLYTGLNREETLLKPFKKPCRVKQTYHRTQDDTHTVRFRLKSVIQVYRYVQCPRDMANSDNREKST